MKTSVQHVTITAANAGQRIDNFLMGYLKHVPKGLIYRIIRKGEVRVNGKRAKPELRVEVDDDVRIPPLHLPDENDHKAKLPKKLLTEIEAAILYEDENLIVVNKPAHLAVHGGTKLDFGLIELMQALRPDVEKLSLAHRLDRETSGCLILSKTRAMLLTLQQAFTDNTVHKTYVALLQGRVREREKWLIDTDVDGKAARTEFNLEKCYHRATLVHAKPRTGRNHQIRVHAASFGHPVMGDDKYADRELNKRAAKLGLKRLFLHASRIKVDLSDFHYHLDISAPLPEVLQEYLGKI